MAKRNKVHSPNKRPPRIFEWLMYIFLSREVRFERLGDFEELYQRKVEKAGRFRGMLWYTGQILRLLKSETRLSTYWSSGMFKNYAKSAFRNLHKYKAFSFINVFGLATGMACCMIIYVYVSYEMSYDNFHEKGDRIYRLIYKNWPASISPLVPALVEEVAGVENGVRIDFAGNLNFTYGNNKQFTQEVFFADSTLFDVFTFTFIQGNAKTALNRHESLVVTESSARKYFGDENPMGKVLSVAGNAGRPDYDLVITGVIKDVPKNSSFTFEFVGSYQGRIQRGNARWLNNWTATSLFSYILLSKGTGGSDIEALLPEFYKERAGRPTSREFYVQPLRDAYLHSAGIPQFILSTYGNYAYVVIFATTAGLILLIACINFMNLSTARSINRAKEVGMRKVVGARRWQLIVQFLSESFIMTIAASVVAIILYELFSPLFGSLVDKDIAFVSKNFTDILPLFLGMAVIVGLVSGSYPAFLLSAFRPIVMLKGKSGGSFSDTVLRKGLVIFQFAISVFLIAGTLVVNYQLSFMREKNLGFAKEQIAVVTQDFGTSRMGTRYLVLKNEFMKNPNINMASASMLVPGETPSNLVYREQGAPNIDETRITVPTNYIDEDYLDMLDIQLVEGRNFSGEIVSDTSSFILNESAVAALVNKFGNQWESPLGRHLDYYWPNASSQGWHVAKSGPVIGVVKDFHFNSLHTAITPMAFVVTPNLFFKMSLKVNTENLSETITHIEDTWKRLMPGQDFAYSFLDESFEALYQSEQQLGEIFTYFSLLAILIACLGLLGLATFTVKQRSREIAVRKVLGAEVSTIVYMLSKDFTKFVVLSNIIAWPAAYYLMNNWLNGFAYKTSISLHVFLLSGLLTFIIAILTVSYQSIRAALSNVIDAIRQE